MDQAPPVKPNQTWHICQQPSATNYLEQKLVLISWSKHTRKDFQVIIAFGCNAFITSIAVCSHMNIVLRRQLACRTFSKCQLNSNESCLSIRAYIYKIHADNHLHKCVCGALSIKMTVLQIQPTHENTAEKND